MQTRNIFFGDKRRSSNNNYLLKCKHEQIYALSCDLNHGPASLPERRRYHDVSIIYIMVNFIINIYTLPDNSHYMSCCVVLSRRVPHMGNYNITAGKNNACT